MPQAAIMDRSPHSPPYKRHRPEQGRKVFTLQTLPSWEEDNRFVQVAKESGFSLHAGVAAQRWERQKLVRLCRYITRPAISWSS